MDENRAVGGRKVVVRVQGGLGNQLFCYATARRLALANRAELVIDNVTGFIRERQFRREFGLDHFRIPVRKATASERLEPFERYRRGLIKWYSRRVPFSKRFYVQEEGSGFDPRILQLQVRRTLYLDGYWQSESFFSDEALTIHEDLRITPPEDDLNKRLADEIRGSQSVALHVRWFNEPGNMEGCNASKGYYQRAFALLEKNLGKVHYYLFSDFPDAAREKLALPPDRVTCVNHNNGDGNAYIDLWLMSQCKHFIIANSTFSWWGAWLSDHEGKMVVAPNLHTVGLAAWGFRGLIPDGWIKL